MTIVTVRAIMHRQRRENRWTPLEPFIRARRPYETLKWTLKVWRACRKYLGQFLSSIGTFGKVHRSFSKAPYPCLKLGRAGSTSSPCISNSPTLQIYSIPKDQDQEHVEDASTETCTNWRLCGLPDTRCFYNTITPFPLRRGEFSRHE